MHESQLPAYKWRLPSRSPVFKTEILPQTRGLNNRGPFVYVDRFHDHLNVCVGIHWEETPDCRGPFLLWTKQTCAPTSRNCRNDRPRHRSSHRPRQSMLGAWPSTRATKTATTTRAVSQAAGRGGPPDKPERSDPCRPGLIDQFPEWSRQPRPQQQSPSRKESPDLAKHLLDTQPLPASSPSSRGQSGPTTSRPCHSESEVLLNA